MTWYDSKRENLGRDFFEDFEVAVQRIKSNPNAFIEVISGVKRILTKKFPYKVFYTISGNTIYILGLIHAKRSKAFVKKELKKMR